MSKNFLTYDEHKALNEIVFENRNKQYGAYVLRAEANQTLQKAFFVGMTFFAVLAATPLLIAKLNKVPIDNDKHGFREVTYIDETEKDKEVWIYDKIYRESTESDSNLALGGAGPVGAGLGFGFFSGGVKNNTTSSKTLTVIIMFNSNNEVEKIDYHTSKY